MDNTPSHGTSALPEMLTDFRLLVLMFLLFRLTLAVAFQPASFALSRVDGTPQIVERGLSAPGDLRYYYEIAQLSAQGDLPYRDFWHEFPPVWSVLFIGLYQLMSVQEPVAYGSWATALGLVMTAVDIGNLMLLRQLANRLYGARLAITLTWIYALLAVPVFIPWWTFEPLVAFLLLAALWSLLRDRPDDSALAIALGILTKYIAVLMLVPVWRFRDRHHAARITLLGMAIVVVVAGTLLLWGGEMARASLLAQVNKASYQTVWALFDGNFRTGVFPPVEAHFEVDTAYDLTGNPPVIRVWLRSIPFVAVAGYVYAHTKRRDDRALVTFVAFMVVLLFLWAQGWSPQWVVTLIPFILLTNPDRSGVLVCLTVSFISILEYPALFAHTVEGSGVISGYLKPLFFMTVVLRTVILAALAFVLMQRLIHEDAHEAD